MSEIPKEYEIEEESISDWVEIGRGGFGVVYSAKYLGAPVAVKIIKGVRRAKKKQVVEIKTMVMLRHPFAVRCLGCFLSDKGKKVNIVMDLMHTNVAEYCQDVGLKEKLTIMVKMATAVQYLHTKTKSKPMIVHNDIKPTNFLVSENGKEVKITDFGLSRIKKHSTIFSNSDNVGGSFLYFPPEFVTGETIICKYSIYSDIYSLGISFYELLFNNPPFFEFDNLNLIGLSKKLSKKKDDRHYYPKYFPEDEDEEIPHVPKDIYEDLLLKMWERIPYQRMPLEVAIQYLTNRISRLGERRSVENVVEVKIDKTPENVKVEKTPSEYYQEGMQLYDGSGKDEGKNKKAFPLFLLASRGGHVEGMFIVGRMYHFGYGVKKDYVEAVKLYRKAAEQGHSSAQYYLGFMYQNGNGVKKDYVEAVKLYRKAAERGHSGAQNNLGFMYDEGLGVKKDYVEAVKLYRKAAEQGLSNGQNNLGLMYKNGNGVKKDYVEAVKLFRKAAEQGHSGAQNNLGFMYKNGNGVKKDYVEAVKLYRKAAEQGLSDGQNNLGLMYDEGLGVKKDYVEAVKLFRKAAEQGHSGAQNNLGFMYENGNGVKKDYVEAVKLYRKAAEQGHSSAQNNLGLMYKNGNGVKKDYVEAVKLYRKAAEQGHSGAQNNLGFMYQNGNGVKKDYVEAVKLYRKAAEQGHSAGQFNLGFMYENGKGVEKSRKTAIYWYEKAAKKGVSQAIQALKRLKN